MKNLTLPFFALLAIIAVCRPADALAQYWLRAQFHLTATVQEPISQTPERTFREKVVKIDNAKMLELLGAATTNDFTGAELAIDHSGLGFFVVKGTNILATVSSLLTRTGASDLFVLGGRQTNDLSFDVTRKAVQEYQFMPLSAEHSFTFFVHERDKMIWAASDTNSPASYFERAQSRGFGVGTWDTRAAVFTGTVELSNGSRGAQMALREQAASLPEKR